MKLLKATNNLKDYALISNMLIEIDDIANQFKKALSNIKDQDEKAILRVFVDNGQRYDLLEKIRNTTYNSDADMDNWIQETIGFKEYCLTFNGVTKWNDTLHTQLTTEVVRPIVDNIGVPLAGIDAYAFVANAGYTPFGIHEDPDHSLIFHLGPDEKHVWIWKNTDYLKLTGSNDRRFDLENLIEYADHFVMKPGDCLFIPKGDFHVFENVGYSAFLGFIMYPSSAGTIGSEGINMLTKLNGDNDEYFVAEKHLKESIHKQIDQITNSHKEDLDNGLKLGSYYYHLLLKSNGYFIHKPNINKIKKEEYQDKSLVKPECFPILYLVESERIAIFVRGRLLRIKNVTGITECIEAINSYNEVTYMNLIDDLRNIISPEVAEYLISCIIQYKGLMIKG
ncbi:hypothetical protein ACIQYG_22085 [Peribacillus sp. NPDC096622]|uniref:hypothetical protein n=1 Tax=Peribacillus sp. NPDC096622 TaxID=3364396 RepID=UPI00380B1C9E